MEPQMSLRAVKVERSRPVAVDLGAGSVRVARRTAHWVVEVGWWRTPPARWQRRDCWRLLLEDGRCLDVYRDEAQASWHLGQLWG
jgi:hypothetical protein